jgi:serine/threonine protein kinase
MLLPSGTRIAQYEIVSSIGSGGMGVVYRARDSRLGRDVAVKVMAPHIAVDPEMRRRFETEARAVAVLSHPSILSIYELAVVDGRPVAVMELLEGQNLRDRLRQGPIAWREAVELGAEIAEGLAAAHAKGVIHRDLKPENIFLTSDGHVKILDFGLALHRLDAPADSADGPTVAATAQGVVMGTFGYMSPEQVTGERVDGRSDIFAVGCLLYEMLTARRLFTGSTAQEVIANLLHDSVPDLSTFDPLAPKELRQIVARCVDRDPARRFDAAHDLSMALRALLTGSAAKLPRQGRTRSKSLAVLPFINAGADPQLEFLTDGITESIINSLSQLDKLRVVPRSLVFRYKGLQADPATVGLALNARTILTGRVTRHGDVLNVQAELVDTVTESQLWGEQIRQKTSDLLALQEEIAWHISEALRLRLTVAQKKKLRKRHTVSLEAYEEYLRGRHIWNNWQVDAFRRALHHFERAIELDPSYALAYAGLGDAYGALAYYGHIAPADGFPRAGAAARRAIELDPDLAEAHATLGEERLFWGWDWHRADRELKHALELNPQLALAHTLYSIVLIIAGRFDEALKAAQTARNLDPLSGFASIGVAWVHHFAGNHTEAMREAQRVRDAAPGFEEAGNILMGTLELLGRYEEAAHLMRQQRCWGLQLDADQMLAAFRGGGPEAYWRKRLELMSAAKDVRAAVQFPFAISHIHLGESDQALDHLEKMVEAHAGGCVFIGVNPTLIALRGNARYEALLRRVGMPRVSAPHTVST